MQVGDIVFIKEIPARFNYLYGPDFEIIEVVGVRFKIRSLETILGHYQIVTIPGKCLCKVK